MDLDEFMKKALFGITPEAFKPFAFYNVHGDMIEVYWENVSGYGEWLNSTITLMKARDDHRVIGVVIEGVSRLEKV